MDQSLRPPLIRETKKKLARVGVRASFSLPAVSRRLSAGAIDSGAIRELPQFALLELLSLPIATAWQLADQERQGHVGGNGACERPAWKASRPYGVHLLPADAEVSTILSLFKRHSFTPRA
jgi:hypothetical protein